MYGGGVFGIFEGCWNVYMSYSCAQQCIYLLMLIKCFIWGHKWLFDWLIHLPINSMVYNIVNIVGSSLLTIKFIYLSCCPCSFFNKHINKNGRILNVANKISMPVSSKWKIKCEVGQYSVLWHKYSWSGPQSTKMEASA